MWDKINILIRCYLALLLLFPLFLLACGPSIEQIEALEKAKFDSVEVSKVEKLNKTVAKLTVHKNDKLEYYSAAELGFVTGEVVMFAPENDVIETWRSAGGNKLDGKIYIQIRSESGKITIIECDYKTWVNIPVGSILK